MSRVLLLASSGDERHDIMQQEIIQYLSADHTIVVINDYPVQTMAAKVNRIQNQDPDFIVALYTVDGDDDFINFALGVISTKYAKQENVFEKKLLTLIEKPRNPKEITKFLRKNFSLRVRNLSFSGIESAQELIDVFLRTRELNNTENEI